MPYAHPPRILRPNFRYSESNAPEIGSDAPADVRDVWQNAYVNAKDYYTSERAPSPDNLARNTAWKTVKMFWEQPSKGRFRMRNPNEPIVAGSVKGTTIGVGQERPLTEPGKTTALCKLIELSWIAPDGSLQVQRFEQPGLPDVFWNKKSKILYMFPEVELVDGVCGSDVFLGLRDQFKMFRTWAKRDPRCRYEIDVPLDPVIAVGVADTIVYRSDKWQKEPNPHPDKLGSQEYLHQFGLDVAVEEAQGDPPPTIQVRGGKLTVLEGGIAN